MPRRTYLGEEDHGPTGLRVGGAVALMGKKPFTPEQRERRRAYLKAWRAEHREHCIAYDKRQRQKRPRATPC